MAEIRAGGMAPQNSRMDFDTYLAIGRRRMWWIILTTVGLFVCTAVATKRMPNVYSASTVILVDSQQVPDKYVPDITTGDIAGRLTTLQQQLLSPTRLKPVVEAQGLYPDPTGNLTEKQVISQVQKAITVELVNPAAGKLGSFRIAFSSKDRLKVAPMANQLAQMFIDENMNVRETQTADTAEFLESQLEDTKRQLDEKDAQLRAIETQNVMDLPESKPYHLEALTNLRAQMTAVQEKIQDAQRQKSLLESMLASGAAAPTVDVEGAAANDGTAGPYDAQLQKAQAHLADLRTHYGPAHPDVRQAQDEINKLKQKIAAAAADPNSAQALEDSRPAIQPNQTNRNPVIEAQIAQLDDEVAQQNKLVGPLQQQIDLHTGKLQQMPVFEQQLGRLQQDYAIIQGHYKNLQDNVEAAQISHALETHQKGERFTVLDKAVTPEAPSAPARVLIDIAGLVGGLLAGLALAMISEFNDKSIRTEKEAARIFGKPVLTETPFVTTAPERRSRMLRLTGALVGTALGSAALGFILPILAGRFL